MRIIRVGLIVLIVLLFIPRVVHAKETGSVYFYTTMNKNDDYLADEIEFIFYDGITTEQKAFHLFDYLFSDREKTMISFVPTNTQLLEVCFQNETLILNITEEGTNCAGNYKETHFVQQIVKTAYSLDEIKSIMLNINGEKALLPEGTDFTSFDRFEMEHELY